MKGFEVGNLVNGSWPSVAAKNCSGAGATDGTALIADWVNNLWGWVQDAIVRAGLTPSGVVEVYAAETGALPLGTTSTQIRTALQMAHGSPGELVLWCRSQAPGSVGARILLLQGQTISISSYPDLVAATYCGDGVNNTAGVPFYKSSDSGGVTRSTSGTYFTLPDARGVTLRGIDIGATRDPLGATRGGGTPNGSIELDALQGHRQNPLAGSDSGFWVSVASAGSYTRSAGSVVRLDTTTGDPTTDGGVTYESKVNTAVRLAVETRMINLATYIGIRF
jgi:hypothetical protein